MKHLHKRDDLIYPELSYKVIGCAFDVYNELGFGHHENAYQRSISLALKNSGIHFKEQVFSPLLYKGNVVGRRYFDFLVEEKLIVELKKDHRFSKQHIDQVKEYLCRSGLKLALLINFTKTKVEYMRVLNLY